MASALQSQTGTAGALSAVADYGDSMVELLVNLPVIAIWGFYHPGAAKGRMDRATTHHVVFFPALGTCCVVPYRRPRLYLFPLSLK